MTFNCRTSCDLQSVAIPTQNRNDKIWFNFTDPIDTCVKVKADSYIATTQDTNMKLDIHFERKRKNKDLLNCPDALCVDRGVVFFNASAVGQLSTTTTSTTTTTTSTSTTTTTTQQEVRDVAVEDVVYNGAVYPIMALTPDYALGGVFTANGHFATAGDYTVIMRFSNEGTESPVNYDEYVQDVTVKDGQVQVNLSAVFSEIPHDMGGTGWNKSVANQSFVQILVLAMDADADIETEVGIGNMQVFDSIAEFSKNNVGWITCIDTFDFNPTIDATDPDCVEQTLDPTTLDASVTITAKKWSPNFLDASPLAERIDEETKAGAIATACGVIDENNVLLLPNFTDIECGFIGAQAEACNADEGYLKYSTITSQALPTGDSFRIVQDEAGNYYAQFPEEYVGEEVTVIYPVLAGVETYKLVVNGKRVRPVRIKVPIRMNGSYDWEYEINGFFNNIPLGMSTTETSAVEFTFTPVVKNGSIGKLRKITDPRVTNVSIL